MLDRDNAIGFSGIETLYKKFSEGKVVEEDIVNLDLESRQGSIKCLFACTKEEDKELTDKEVHKIIDSLDPSLRTIETFDGKERVKEFYAMMPEAAYQLFECIAKISGTEDRLKKMTPEGHEILDEEIAQEIQNEARRGPFRFSLFDIPIGSEITFIGDKSVKATVVNDRQVEYNGVTTSLCPGATA